MRNLKERLEKNTFFFGCWSGTAVFLAYFSMYMLRKPYTAHTYESLFIWGFDYKIILVISQVLGYALSKFIGISVIPKVRQAWRLTMLGVLLLMAWLSLFFFSMASKEWGLFWMFCNGLPLGLIWGVVFTYCEGRRLTEVLTVILSVNFIFSSGFAKSLGLYILQLDKNYQDMPMIAGIVISPLLVLSILMLSQIPTPSSKEVSDRSQRVPMNKKEKRIFLRDYGSYVFLFTLLYLFLTIIRDVRDNFAVEIWSGLGYFNDPSIYTLAETPVALIVLIGLALLYKIKNNLQALRVNLWISMVGLVVITLSSIGLNLNIGADVLLMIVLGIGLFLPYILLNGIIFDRFIAHYRVRGNVGFIQYIADAIGYLGSVGILLYKSLFEKVVDWLQFFLMLSIVGGVVGILISTVLLYLLKRNNPSRKIIIAQEVNAIQT